MKQLLEEEELAEEPAMVLALVLVGSPTLKLTLSLKENWPGVLWVPPLRLGGSAEDATVFATSEADCARQLAQGRPGSAEGYVCKGQPTRCLLASRWEAWLRFANKTGLRPVLGLDGCFGRAGRSLAASRAVPFKMSGYHCGPTSMSSR